MKYFFILVSLFLVSCKADREDCTKNIKNLFPDSYIVSVPKVVYDDRVNYYFVDGNLYSCFQHFSPEISKHKLKEIQKGSK